MPINTNDNQKAPAALVLIVPAASNNKLAKDGHEDKKNRSIVYFTLPDKCIRLPIDLLARKFLTMGC